MKKGVEKVSVLKCKSYKRSEIDNILERSLKLIDFDFSKYKGKKVLLKPNLVTADCQKPVAALTNKSLVEGMCKILKKNKCKIYIGESSFMDTDVFLRNWVMISWLKSMELNWLFLNKTNYQKLKILNTKY